MISVLATEYSRKLIFFLRIEAVALKKKNTDQPFLGGAARPNNQRSGLLIGLGFEP